ncbi:PilZ domain-containing protein [Geomonas sp. RF6]|uniref:PilZ domain-containing protein n=1 Tax=Geomonas sp. RF6 TaxID=2897342 RepID=UPI001E4C4D7D|nr:PilZ domain-containing protein [Geomonas sp. RF6]UFS72306.1 PilZ domain-containing protein [Geomonas sp. RF6]
MDEDYQRFQIAGETEDSARILSILSAIQEGKLKNDLRLVNYFHEVPLSYAATVVSVAPGAVELEVHQHQAVAISLAKLTVLKSSHFPQDVIASVVDVSVKHSLVRMNRFAFGILRAERRMSVRVRLDDHIRADFSSPDEQASGTLEDMSLSGVSVVIDGTSRPFAGSVKGDLTVELPTGTVTVQASLLKLRQVPKGWRAVFQISAGRVEEESIARFIMQRQVAIIRELKDHPELKRSA